MVLVLGVSLEWPIDPLDSGRSQQKSGISGGRIVMFADYISVAFGFAALSISSSAAFTIRPLEHSRAAAAQTRIHTHEMLARNAGKSSGRPFEIKRIDHIVIRCRGFPEMFDFYHRVLGCTLDEPEGDHLNRFGGALTHLRAGESYIDLLSYDDGHLTGDGVAAVQRMHAGGVGTKRSLDDLALSAEESTLDHLCLRVRGFEMQSMIAYLESEGAQIVTSGDRRLGADGVGPSVYVRDPEGNVVELKGDPYPVAADQGDGQRKAKELQSTSPSRKETTTRRKDEVATAKVESVPSTPCNRICRYNGSFFEGKVCSKSLPFCGSSLRSQTPLVHQHANRNCAVGCFRETYEIQTWQSMGPYEKSLALLDAIDRCESVAESFEGAVQVSDLVSQREYWQTLATR